MMLQRVPETCMCSLRNSNKRSNNVLIIQVRLEHYQDTKWPHFTFLQCIIMVSRYTFTGMFLKLTAKWLRQLSLQVASLQSDLW